MVDHTVKSYDKELESLERRIAEMGGIAEKMVIDAMDALAGADAALDAFGGVAFGLEIVGQQQREIGLILYDQDSGLGAVGSGGFSARLVHDCSLPSSSRSESVRPFGRSTGSGAPVTR